MGIATMHINTSAAANDMGASSPNEMNVAVIVVDWTEHVPSLCPLLVEAVDWEVVVVVLVQ